jgi:hypothetical protein
MDQLTRIKGGFQPVIEITASETVERNSCAAQIHRSCSEKRIRSI